jgi:hypothetical protein
MGSAGGAPRQQARLLGSGGGGGGGGGGGFDTSGGRRPGNRFGITRASPGLPPESPALLPMAPRGGSRGGAFDDVNHLSMGDDQAAKHMGHMGGGATMGSGAGAALNSLLGHSGGTAIRRVGGGGGGLMLGGGSLGRGGPAVRACVMSE